MSASTTGDRRYVAGQAQHQLRQALREALCGRDDNDGRRRMLAIALLTAYSLIEAMPSRCRRPFALVLAATIQMLTSEKAKQGTGDLTTIQDAPDRRMRLLGFVTSLALLGTASTDAVGADFQRAARERLGRLAQAHMRVAGSAQPHIEGWTATATVDGDGLLDDVAVPATSIGSIRFLLEHLRRLPLAADVPVDEGSGGDPLGDVQAVGDAVAARAEELGVHVSIAMAGAVQAEQRAAEAAFSCSGTVLAADAWAACPGAAPALRHLLLDAASLVLEHSLRTGDSLCLVPCSAPPESPDGPSDLAVFLVCRGASRARMRSTKSVQDDQPAAGYSMPGAYSAPDLRGLQSLARSVYGKRAEVDVRTATEGGEWLVVRLRLPGALDALAAPVVATADVSSPAVLDGVHAVPQLGEFRAMLRGARVVVRTVAATPRIDSAGSHTALRTLPLADCAGRDLRAAEAFLDAAGCTVERLATSYATRSPGTPGLSRQLVAQRPPAFIIVDGGADVLRAEFELLRGTLSFAAKADALQRGRAHSAATLGIVALVPLSAVARVRACVRALVAEPHALPPPVVKIVALPLGERRLLAGLRAAWALRRLERRHVTPLAPAAAFYALPARSDAAFTFTRGPPVTPSPPRSAASDGLYDNLRTVSSTSPPSSANTSESAVGVPAWSAAQPAWSAAPPEPSVAPSAWTGAAILPPVTHIDIPGNSIADAPIVPDRPVHTPPSPLIEVNSSLARTLRFAAAADEPRAASPGTTSAPQTARSASASVVDIDAPSANPANHASAGAVSSAPLEPPQPVLEARTDPASTPPTGPGESEATELPAEQRSLSRTRSLLRDKMALFNRARHRARNKQRQGSDVELPSSSALLPPRRGDADLEDEPSESVELPDNKADTESAVEESALLVESPALISLPEPKLADLDKPLPRLPTAATMPAESPRSVIAAPAFDVGTPVAAADKPQPSAQKPAANPARDRKARLRARLQDAGRRMAESQQQQRNKDRAAETSNADADSAEVGASAESMRSLSPARPQTDASSSAEAPGLRVRQPRAQAEVLAAPEPALGGMSDSTPPIRVLLVEDNLINRSIMERFLRHMKVRYDVASNGEEAIRMWTAAAEELGTPGGSSSVAPAAVGRGPYHIVFMDIQMPIMDGIQATKRIRELERQRHIGLWVPNGSMASMGAERLLSATARNSLHDAGQQRTFGIPRELGESSPRTVRWVPMHVRRLPPSARNSRYLHRHGLVQSVPTATLGNDAATGLVSEQDTAAAVRRNCSLSALRHSPMGVSVNIPTIHRRPSARSVSVSSRNLTVSTATTPTLSQQQTQLHQPKTECRQGLHSEETTEDIGGAAGPLMSPDDVEIDSARHVAMFPPGANIAASAPVPPPSRGESPGLAGHWQNGRLARTLQLPPLQRQKQRGQAGERSHQLKSSSSGKVDSPLPLSVKSPVIIVALTASSLESDRRAALSAGCNDFLTKPVSLIWLKLKIIEWGCMQALIDHDGWRKWRSKRSHFEGSL